MNERRTQWIRRSFGALALGLLALVAVGCGRPNRVTGRVTFDGQPLPAGAVTFLCDGGQRPVLAGRIDADGTYEIPAAPLGRARISVETFKPTPKPKPGIDPQTGIDDSLGWEDTGPYVPIPKRYGSVKTSGLEYTIVPGEQTFDIALME
jgi:hypothetical protein